MLSGSFSSHECGVSEKGFSSLSDRAGAHNRGIRFGLRIIDWSSEHTKYLFFFSLHYRLHSNRSWISGQWTLWRWEANFDSETIHSTRITENKRSSHFVTQMFGHVPKFTKIFVKSKTSQDSVRHGFHWIDEENLENCRKSCSSTSLLASSGYILLSRSHLILWSIYLDSLKVLFEKYCLLIMLWSEKKGEVRKEWRFLLSECIYNYKRSNATRQIK